MRFLSLTEHYDFAVSNPPYIPTKDLKLLDKSVQKYDPKIALDGGKDGLDYYRVLSKIKGLPLLFVEIGIHQKSSPSLIVSQAFIFAATCNDHQHT